MNAQEPMEKSSKDPKEESEQDQPLDPALLALFRLLMKEPPKDHDITTCPICKKFGIREI